MSSIRMNSWDWVQLTYTSHVCTSGLPFGGDKRGMSWLQWRRSPLCFGRIIIDLKPVLLFYRKKREGCREAVQINHGI